MHVLTFFPEPLSGLSVSGVAESVVPFLKHSLYYTVNEAFVMNAQGLLLTFYTLFFSGRHVVY